MPAIKLIINKKRIDKFHDIEMQIDYIENIALQILCAFFCVCFIGNFEFDTQTTNIHKNTL